MNCDFNADISSEFVKNTFNVQNLSYNPIYCAIFKYFWFVVERNVLYAVRLNHSGAAIETSFA